MAGANIRPLFDQVKKKRKRILQQNNDLTL